MYSFAREVEDVLTVIELPDGPVRLVGHSFGAILCVFAVSRSRTRVNAVARYDPPLGVQHADDRWLNDLDATIDSGDLDSAIRKFAVAANITDDELEVIHAAEPAWAALRDGVRVAAGDSSGEVRLALPHRRPRRDCGSRPRSTRQ